MPSRAVLKKKARRESKRLKAQSDATSVACVDTDKEARAKGNVVSKTCNRTALTVSNTIKSTSECLGQSTAAFERTSAPVSARHAVVKHERDEVSGNRLHKRHRNEKADHAVCRGGSVDDSRVTFAERSSEADEWGSGMTHRERKKLAARRHLERQISRINASTSRGAAAGLTYVGPESNEPCHSRDEEVIQSGLGSEQTVPHEVNEQHNMTGRLEQTTLQKAPNECTAPLTSQRHDPRFTNGTYWRNKKERRARTLFLGGMPASYSVQTVKEFIAAMLDSDEHATSYITQLSDSADENVSAIETIDMLPARANAAVKHMYVTMASVALAGCVAAKLDGHAMSGARLLRCNFAADKTQRSEAIRRRNDNARRGGYGYS